MLTKLDSLKMKKNNEKPAMITAYDYPGVKPEQREGLDVSFLKSKKNKG